MRSVEVLIIWNQPQLERLAVDYIDHHYRHRPHRSLDQLPPLAATIHRHTLPARDPIRRRNGAALTPSGRTTLTLCRRRKSSSWIKRSPPRWET